MTTQTSLLVIVLVALVLAGTLWRYRARRKRDADMTWRLAGAVARSVSASGTERSAAELLALVRTLSARGETWPEILGAVNPTGDPLVARKLNLLRGPHQFVPHLALNVLEHGCERALVRNPYAGQSEAIDAAVQSAAVVVGAGD